MGRGCCVHDCSVHRSQMRPSDSLELELLRKTPGMGVENQTQVPQEHYWFLISEPSLQFSSVSLKFVGLILLFCNLSFLFDSIL